VFFKVARVALGDNRIYQDIKNIVGNPVGTPFNQEPLAEIEE
jgi:hypothetical protein